MKLISKFPSFLSTVIIVTIIGSGCQKTDTAPPQSHLATPPTVTPKIIATLPHEPSSFTQGLLFHNGNLYESTGLHGSSRLQIIDTATGTITLSRTVDTAYFAEGCAILNNHIFQITWQKQTCFVYSLKDLVCTDTLYYGGEGWGLTSDNDKNLFFMSNGSDTLYTRNQSFKVINRVAVTLAGKPLTSLNELEFARGFIYANVWYSDFIFEIDPKSGVVTKIIDCSEVVAKEVPASEQAVLNGIAYNQKSGEFFITGKNWKTVFIVQID